jgi:hypothetical protein
VEHYDPNSLYKWDSDALEHYVPLHTTDLVEFLAQHPVLTHESAGMFRQIAMLILSMEHHLYRQRHEQLLYAYAPLDPDLDRMLASVPTPSQRDSLIEETRGRIQSVLKRANYQQLNQNEIDLTLQASSAWGVRMRVDFGLQEWMDVYARGLVTGTRHRRTWRNLYRDEAYEVPLYQRLVVVFRARENHPQKFDSQRVYLRMFKNVPRLDIDMMLPGAGVHMTWVDHSKIVLPSMYTAGMTMWRFTKYFFMLALLGAFKTVGIVLIAALAICYGAKSMFTFRTNTQRRYLLNMTQSLYYQSLGNNMGVLLRLLEEGEQQESCECILTYFVALKSGFQPMTLEQINLECRDLIQQATGIDTEFDTESTVKNLVQLGLVRYQQNGWVALLPHEALEQLDRIWDDWFNA